MKLSIIIPYYNAALTLPRLLDSILDETKDAEIIVVDDRSEEDLQLFEELKTKYAEYVSFYINDRVNKGAGTARNIGLEHACGEWMIFADADDYLCKGWYDAVSSYFDKEYDLIYFTPVSIFGLDGKPGVRSIPYAKMNEEYIAKNGSHTSELFVRCFQIVPWSKMVKTELIRLNNILFDEIRYSNDVLFATKIGVKAGKVTCDSRPIYCLVEGTTNLSSNISMDAWEIRHDAFCRRNLFLKQELSRKDYKFVSRRLGSAGRLIYALQKKCGLRKFREYCAMYRKNGITFGDVLRSMGYSFYKLLVNKRDAKLNV